VPRDAHPIEQAVGVEYYARASPGTGWRLKATAGDFRVREVEAVDPQPLDADPASYPHLVLRVTLEGWDTNDFARELSNRLGVGRERVAWAGTKDKRAITTQLVTIRGVEADDLPSLPNASIEPVGRFGRALAFGDLAGNAFTIRVSDPRPGERGRH
jgi:tRNA pseudouridine13 synthase